MRFIYNDWNLEKQPWETPFPWTCYPVPRYSALAHLPLSWSHDRPRAAAMQLPDLFSNHIWAQGKLQSTIWNVCMCECDFTRFQSVPLMLWGLPSLWGEYSTVCFEICDHWTVSSQRHTDPIINSLRLIMFGDGTLASFCYWMRRPDCTFVPRAVQQNELLRLLFNELNTE